MSRRQATARSILSTLTAAALVASSGGCASTRLDEISGSNFRPETDERELWDAAELYHAAVEDREWLFEDDDLQAYLGAIAGRLLTAMDAPAAEVHVRVLKNPLLNAAAFADGVIYLHSGILARVENEGQLAVLLGHELTHYLRRHSLREMRAAENRRTAANVAIGILAVLVAASGDPNAVASVLELSGSAADHMLLVQTSGYSQDLEREADDLGMRAAVSAGYDARSAIDLFELLAADARAEEAGAKVEDPYYYSSHPKMSERVATSREIMAELRDATGNAVTPHERAAPPPALQSYDGHISPLLLANAGFDLALGRRIAARHGIDRYIASNPDDAKGFELSGRLHRATLARPGSLAAAIAAYEQAALYAPESVEAHRQLGLLYEASNDPTAARPHLERYLELASDAPDRAIIEVLIDQTEAVIQNGSSR